MIDSICKELEIRNDYLMEDVATVYFGGGTPSILHVEQIDKIIATIYQNFKVNEDVEITLEANPDDITELNLLAWKSIGINRFSLGIQSFDDEELKFMNRSHNALQAKQCIELIQKYFTNFSIDIIFGSQILTTDKLLKNLEIAIQYNIPHISCYGLTIEEKTILDKKIKEKQIEPIDDKRQAEHFEQVMIKLTNAGYSHYEISNYAKLGFESKHNSNYWKGKHYLGVGPSAHSFNGNTRCWNINNNSLYITSIENNILPQQSETLSLKNKFNEYIMIGLRTAKGIDLTELESEWISFYTNEMKNKMDELCDLDYLRKQGNKVSLTNTGKLFADSIISDFFQV